MKTTQSGMVALFGAGIAFLGLTVAPTTMASATPLVKRTINVPCSGPGGGVPGLIAAISTANGGSRTTIQLAKGCTYALNSINNGNPSTAAGANGLPVVTSQVIVAGHGSTISGPNTDFRIFEVNGPDGDLALRNLTITGGSSALGGAIFNEEGTVILNNSLLTGNTGQMGGGAIASGVLDPDDMGPVGTLIINNSEISRNTASFGGGIVNAEGTVTLNDSQVNNNFSPPSMGGVGGGGIASGVINPAHLGPIGTLTLHNSQVDDNTSPTGGGGGILNHAGALTLDNSQVNGNSAANGGGVASGSGNGGTAGSSSLIVKNSQVNDNTATSGLGGNGAGGIANGSFASLNQAQVNGNKAPGGLGGGIVNHGTMTITNSEVNGNSAPSDTMDNAGSGGGIINFNAGVSAMPIPNSGVLLIKNSQVNGNKASDGVGGGILNNVPGQLPATLTVKRSQVEGNSASEGGAIYNVGGPVTTALSQFTNNNPDNCFPLGSILGCIG